MSRPPIEFMGIKAQQGPIREKIEKAIHKVLDHGMYIMGPEVFELEERLSDFCGVKHTISCSNGTDALGLVMMAKKIKPGDAVFVPSYTFAATAEIVAWVGATPIFIDSLEDTYNMDPQSLRQGIQKAKSLGLTPKAIIVVDLFGQPADYTEIQEIAEEHDLWILGDAAQSFGASYKDKKVGNIVDITTTSFFPSKPLACYGEGGAVFTNDDDLAEVLKSLRVHGQGADKYENVRIGTNGRLETLQAAVLLQKLDILEEEIQQRNRVAQRYREGLKDVVKTPRIAPERLSAWAIYTMVLPESVDRSALIQSLQKKEVPAVIYYPKPLHHQPAYRDYPTASGSCLPVCEGLIKRVLSLPMHPYLSDETLDYIIESVVNEIKR